MVNNAWVSQKMDVITVFLNGLLKEEVYLKKPEGFTDKNHPDWMWHVPASLYGLKESPHEWNSMLTSKLSSQGMKQSKHDPVLFLKKQHGRTVGVVVAHFDNILLTGKPDFVDEQDTKIQTTFKMLKSGSLDTYLSLKVGRGENEEVFLSQSHKTQSNM